MALQRSRGPGTVGSSSVPVAETAALFKQLGTLVEFLSLGKWEDGTSRQSGTMTILWEDGLYKAALNDRDASLSTFVSGHTLADLLKAVEEGLATQNLEWREKRPWVPGKSKKGG